MSAIDPKADMQIVCVQPLQRGKSTTIFELRCGFTLLLIDLPKSSHLMRESLETEALSALASQILFKGKLRAW
jgi:hypothetical protein